METGPYLSSPPSLHVNQLSPKIKRQSSEPAKVSEHKEETKVNHTSAEHINPHKIYSLASPSMLKSRSFSWHLNHQTQSLRKEEKRKTLNEKLTTILLSSGLYIIAEDGRIVKIKNKTSEKNESFKI